jgi:hypothetical protein
MITDRQRSNTFYAALYGTLAAALFNVEPVFVDAVRQQLHFSETQIGWLAGCELAGIALMSVMSAVGPAFVRRGYPAVIAIAVYIAGNLLSLGVDNWLALCVLRFLVGLFGEGQLYALSAAIAGRSEQPARAFAWVTLMQVVFAVVGLSLMPHAIGTWGMAGVLLPLSLAAVLCIPVVMRDRTSQASHVATRCTPGSQDLLAISCALAIIIWHCGIGAYWVFSSDFGRAAGIDAIRTGQALAMGMACGIPGALAPALLPRSWSHGWLFAAGMALQLAAIAAMHWASGWAAYATAVITWNFSWNFAIPYILSLFALTDRDNRLIRLSPAAQGLGLAIGPAVGGSRGARRGVGARRRGYA